LNTYNKNQGSVSHKKNKYVIVYEVDKVEGKTHLCPQNRHAISQKCGSIHQPCSRPSSSQT
jgi:hypothetical protein